jgi:hypothetical protein
MEHGANPLLNPLYIPLEARDRSFGPHVEEIESVPQPGINSRHHAP